MPGRRIPAEMLEPSTPYLAERLLAAFFSSASPSLLFRFQEIVPSSFQLHSPFTLTDEFDRRRCNSAAPSCGCVLYQHVTRHAKNRRLPMALAQITYSHSAGSETESENAAGYRQLIGPPLQAPEQKMGDSVVALMLTMLAKQLTHQSRRLRLYSLLECHGCIIVSLSLDSN